MRNVTSSGGLLPAGIIRCNETNPCTNFTFEDVNVTSEFWDTLGYGFITENIEGTSTRSFPDPGFKKAQTHQKMLESPTISAITGPKDRIDWNTFKKVIGEPISNDKLM